MGNSINVRQQLGRHGEQWAVEYLRRHGYKILDRNVFFRWAEIDIIARRHGTIHFFEVKTRRTDKHGRPAAAINLKKIQKLQLSARYYVAQHHLKYDGLALGVIECWQEPDQHIGTAWKIRCIPNIVM